LDATQGVITGIPSAAGTASFEIAAADAAGSTAMKSLTLTVGAGNWATTYYVDASAGRDTNSGTSQSAAWQSVAKVNSAKFSPGDQILFKRGEVWRDELDFPSSGRSGEPILIGAYGTGAAPVISGADVVPSGAWTRCSGCAANVWEAAVKTQPNIVIFGGAGGTKQGSEAAVAKAGDWFWSAGKLFVWAAGNPANAYRSPGVESGSRDLGLGLFAISFVSVEDLQFVAANGLPTQGAVFAGGLAGTGQTSHDLDFARLTVADGAADGIHLEDCNNCVVENSTVSGMARAGVMLTSSRPQAPVTAAAVLGNTVANNHFDGISIFGCAIGQKCEGAVLPAGQFFSGMIIAGNTAHDNGAGIYVRWTNHSSVTANVSFRNTDTSANGEGYGIGIEASSNNTIAKNLLYSNRTRGIELSNDGGVGTKATGASNNVVEYNAVHDNGDHGIFTNAAPTQSNQFLYNVVWNHPNGECFLANGVGHVFYGNTCWNSSTGIELYTSSDTPSTGGITVKNNIFAKNVVHSVHVDAGVTMGSVAFDYNAYEGGTTPFMVNGQNDDVKEWQAKGFDVHGLFANPGFLNTSPAAAGDLAVLAGSAAAIGGTNLGARFAMGVGTGSAWPGAVKTSAQGTEWSMGAVMQK
jgi:parallel beta-helix repeat protein